MPDGCTVRSCKPAWACQEIKYLETHTGLNQTERQSCKRTSEKKLKIPLDQLDELFSHGCMAWECLSNLTIQLEKLSCYNDWLSEWKK